MRVNRIAFDKIKLEWEVSKYNRGVRDFFEEQGLEVESEETVIPLDDAVQGMFDEMLENASPELRAHLGLDVDATNKKPKLKENSSMKDQIEFKIHEAADAILKALEVEDYLLAAKLQKQLDSLRSDLEALEASGEDM